MNALNLPAAGVDEPFMKNDIVIGIIGNTQGVSSIAKPHSIASKIRPQMKPSDFCSCRGELPADVSMLMANCWYSGEAQN